MELRETASLAGEKLYPDKLDAIQEQASLHTQVDTKANTFGFSKR